MIPKKVKIGWREYKITQAEHKEGSDGCDLYGEIDYARHSIYLYDKQPEYNKPVTLLHEIIHGIFYISGHEEWRKNEDLIDCIAENLYQVLLDNPGIFNFKEESNETETTTT